VSHDYARARARMVATQLRARGIGDERVLAAFGEVPRHRFVDPALADEAYADRPLPIGSGQTISQPYMTALMTELCEPHPHDRVLEVGTGSGYQAAVLSRLVHSVFTIERLPELAEKAGRALAVLGVTNVIQRVGDGSTGWSSHAPFQAILVTAAAPEVPRSLLAQLADGGRLILPAGRREGQTLVCLRRDGGDFVRAEHSGCTFVPLVGKEGWRDD